MIRNIGSADSLIRMIVAAAFAVLYFTNAVTGTLGIAMLIVAGALTITGLVGFCPLYSILRINTRNKNKEI